MKNFQKLILASLFLCIGLVLPFFTMQLREIGKMLLPMHIPVLICGFLCKWKYGAIVGFLTPLLRSFIFGMPLLFPSAVCMSIELATYGTLVGILSEVLPNWKLRIYVSLLIAMLTGRIVWGAASILAYGMVNSTFTWQMFIGGAVLNAIPGIVLQLILIPPIIFILERIDIIKSKM